MTKAKMNATSAGQGDASAVASGDTTASSLSETQLASAELPGLWQLAGSDRDPEIVIGLVGAMGTDLAKVRSTLRDSLRRFAYDMSEVKLSKEMCQIEGFGPYPTGVSEDERYLDLMSRGTKFREELGEESLAMLAVLAIRSQRHSITDNSMLPARRHAFIIHSLKHPAEVKALRRTYGRRFILLGAYASRDQRVADLSARIADSLHRAQAADQRGRAEKLILRDELERDEEQRLPIPLGQKVSEVFPLADAFVDARDRMRLIASVDRFVDLLFGAGLHTPSRDEQGMFFAHAAALRSSSLARQVGAALTSNDGEILAVGVNEVPKAGGGAYWEGDSPDDRDYAWGRDVSDEYRRQLAADALNLLQGAKWLSGAYAAEPIPSLVSKALDESTTPPGPLAQARLMDVMEYVRAVHAEMAAITDAARKGVTTKGSTLYVTTFPCHECARLIVASGIGRVVYVEPYPKSLAQQLYPSAIEVEAEGPCGGRVPFEPFIGIAPRRYADFFVAREKRKAKGTGLLITVNPAEARPRVPGPYSLHLVAETFAVAALEQKLKVMYAAQTKEMD
jgi:deoxycytidylate deaminase